MRTLVIEKRAQSFCKKVFNPRVVAACQSWQNVWFLENNGALSLAFALVKPGFTALFENWL